MDNNGRRTSPLHRAMPDAHDPSPEQLDMCIEMLESAREALNAVTETVRDILRLALAVDPHEQFVWRIAMDARMDDYLLAQCVWHTITSKNFHVRFYTNIDGGSDPAASFDEKRLNDIMELVKAGKSQKKIPLSHATFERLDDDADVEIVFLSSRTKGLPSLLKRITKNSRSLSSVWIVQAQDTRTPVREAIDGAVDAVLAMDKRFKAKQMEDWPVRLIQLTRPYEVTEQGTQDTPGYSRKGQRKRRSSVRFM